MGRPRLCTETQSAWRSVIQAVTLGMVGGLELLRGEERKGVEESRRHAAEAMCFLRIDRLS